MRHVLVFDVNETLLDLGALDPIFEQLFGDPAARREWFGQLLQSTFVSTITNAYRDFGALGTTALAMVAARRGLTLTEAQVAAVRAGMRALPAHPEARPALEELRQPGFRLATLTNSTAEVGEAQLRAAGLRDLFEQALSADAVQRLKPAPEPYRMAAERLGIAPAELRLVAARLRGRLRRPSRAGARSGRRRAGDRRRESPRGRHADHRARPLRWTLFIELRRRAEEKPCSRSSTARDVRCVHRRRPAAHGADRSR